MSFPILGLRGVLSITDLEILIALYQGEKQWSELADMLTIDPKQSSGAYLLKLKHLDFADAVNFGWHNTRCFIKEKGVRYIEYLKGQMVRIDR